MKPETKYNLKAFMWDQLIRPVMNSNFLRLVFLIMIFVSIVVFKSVNLFFVFIVLTLLISIYELVKYYKSGEYKDNYRKFKYPDYRKTMKEIRQAKKTPSSNTEGAGETRDHFEPPLVLKDSGVLPCNINHEEK